MNIVAETFLRIGRRHHRSWFTLYANDNTPMTYWDELQLALYLQDRGA